MLKKVVILNGPNLNMLGHREKEIYGTTTLSDIEKSLDDFIHHFNKSSSDKVALSYLQSNSEGELVAKIHKCFEENIDFLIINPGAYSHTSVAILDALSILKCPIAEVHLSNTNKREDFRLKKLTARAATYVLEGLGASGYQLALQAFLNK